MQNLLTKQLSRIVYTALLAIPFWFIWSIGGIGETFFAFLPPVYLHPSILQCIGIFIVVPIAYHVFIPRIVNIHIEHTNINMKDLPRLLIGDETRFKP